MKAILTLVLASFWAVALAQTPPGEEQPEGDDAREQVEEGTLDEEAPAEEGPSEDEEEEEGLADLPPAVETNPIPEPPPPEAETAGADEEFEPDEEISEDYPVPLPSDI